MIYFIFQLYKKKTIYYNYGIEYNKYKLVDFLSLI